MTSLIVVFVAIVLLVTIANRINVAYPIVLVHRRVQRVLDLQTLEAQLLGAAARWA